MDLTLAAVALAVLVGMTIGLLTYRRRWLGSLATTTTAAFRDDGFPGLAKTYAFTLPDPQVHLLNDAVVYPSVGKGDPCGFGSVASTDGRVAGQKLTVLEDDKHFFPTYNPAITIASGLAGKYPQLEQVFTPIAAKLDTATLTELNKKVSVDGRKPAAVAHDWLKAAGFII
ncbi:glycine betaine ABC transporter substrate-binding protein [Amycolatopsis mongoliensis]|uniref:Glycine betaine ABC transporter substrate-binding protein n=1 Tax=Amycolatopsis mongoliensis TaxID=715475 RepID=A0A9Y2JL95_9PSEU|nr:glycine betaine ABC transporter substrate-binding protein [Amycolatopsis sp. 4-36]WIY00686.1 glycine betaine ABC transporter substrate-binding protein [Amycolatopsis sp. 4-36]